jgi:hypothetical protein
MRAACDQLGEVDDIPGFLHPFIQLAISNTGKERMTGATIYVMGVICLQPFQTSGPVRSEEF